MCSRPRARLALCGLERPAVTAALLIMVAALLRLPTLAQPLVDGDHGFRQTQTAFTVKVFAEQGIDLLRPILPVLGPPWVVPFEFPLFQALAAVLAATGVPIEVAVRVTCLAFFLLSATLLCLLLFVQAGPRPALIGLAFYLFVPLSLIWSRSGLIEYVPVAAVLGALLGLYLWDANGSRAWFAAALGCAVVAMLVKPPTAAIWLLTSLLWWRRSRGVVALLAIAAAAGATWTMYADGLKSAVPATAGLGSGTLREWNVGTLAQRVDPYTWLYILRWSLLPLAAPLLALALPALRAGSPGRRLAIAAAFAFVAGPVVFTNLYAEHTYYWTAVSPAAAMLVGIGAARVLDTLKSRRERHTFVAMTAVALGMVVAVTAPTWLRVYQPVDDPRNVLAVASVIRTSTAPDDRVMITGYDWSPELLFYADRWGYMVREGDRPDPTGYRLFHCVTVAYVLAGCTEGSPSTP